MNSSSHIMDTISKIEEAIAEYVTTKKAMLTHSIKLKAHLSSEDNDKLHLSFTLQISSLLFKLEYYNQILADMEKHADKQLIKMICKTRTKVIAVLKSQTC
jgi:hypothetical protein